MLPTNITTQGWCRVTLVRPMLRYPCQFVVPHLRRQTGLFNIPLNSDTNWNTKNIHCCEITDCQSVHQSTKQTVNTSINPIPFIRPSICLAHLSVCLSLCVSFRSSFICQPVFVFYFVCSLPLKLTTIKILKRYKQSNTTHQLFVKHTKTATCFGFIN
jgi:hypothetical protein